MMWSLSVVACGFLVSSPLTPRTFDVHREALRLPSPTVAPARVAPQIPAPQLHRLVPTHNLFAAALRWGMLQSSDVDDAMLALVAPQTFLFLREWQQRNYG